LSTKQSGSITGFSY